MRIWLLRIFAIVMVISTIAVPQASLWAQEEMPGATPVVPAANPTAPTDEDASTPVAPDEDEAEGDDADPAQSGRMAPLAEIDQNFGLTAGSYDELTGILTLDLTLFPGFAASAGDTIEVYYTSDQITIAPGPHSVPGTSMTVTADNSSELLTITFHEEVPAVTDEMQTVSVPLPAVVHFPACQPTGDEHVATAEITFLAGDYYSLTIEVSGETCPANGGVNVDDVQFSPEIGFVGILFSVTSNTDISGTVIRITYPEDTIVVEPGPVDVVIDYWDSSTVVSHGTAVAGDGVITITFNDEVVAGNDREYGALYLRASLSTQTCDPDQGVYTQSIGRIVFVATPGGPFTSLLPTSETGPFQSLIACNGAPASKVGELSEDGTLVNWTIDTGHLINGATVYDGQFVGLDQFLCDSVVVTPESPDTTFTIDCDGDQWGGLSVYLYGEGIVRATITFSTLPSPEYSQDMYLNCAVISAGSGMTRTMARSTDTAGVGGTVCAWVFPDGAADVVTNDVSATEVYQGDELTFDVSFSTPTGIWWTMTLDDVLPSGFTATDITCDFSPADLAGGDCVVNDDNTVSVFLRRFAMEEAQMEPGEISLRITGTVTATPGTELVSTACGERLLDVPMQTPILWHLNTGPICASTSTMVLQVPSTETPVPTVVPTETAPPTVIPTETPSPTAAVDPTVPATPATSPTMPVTPDPTSTSAPVTGLPETGNGTSNASAAWMVAASAAMLMATLVGIRIRTGRE